MKKFIRKIGIFLNFIDPPSRSKELFIVGGLLDKKMTFIKNNDTFIISSTIKSKQDVNIREQVLFINHQQARQLSEFINEHI